MWTTRTRATTEVWPGWHAALLQSDESGSYSCCLPITGGRLLLTKKRAEKQTGYKAFVVRGGQSPEYRFIGTGDVSAYFCDTERPHSYLDYSHEPERLSRRALVMEKVEVLPSSVFFRHGYILHREDALGRRCCILYFTYRTPETHRSSNIIAFV